LEIFFDLDLMDETSNFEPAEHDYKVLELFAGAGGLAVGLEQSGLECIALKSSIKFTAPVIKKDEEVHEDNEIKSQEDLNATKVSISIADVKGNDEANGKDIADLKQVVTQAAPEPEKVFDMVEQMPTFPGGQTELMAYLGKNIKYPTIAQENGTQGRVIIQFVVERDGSISDVHVARGVDPYLDKEAVRVVKSMPKWLPGKQNGKAVRVKFTVPVMFRLQ
jgi:protein TonB